MKISVDPDRCRGHGVCLGLSEVFTLTDDGYAEAREEAPAGLENAVLEAVDNCPERAIEAT